MGKVPDNVPEVSVCYVGLWQFDILFSIQLHRILDPDPIEDKQRTRI